MEFLGKSHNTFPLNSLYSNTFPNRSPLSKTITSPAAATGNFMDLRLAAIELNRQFLNKFANEYNLPKIPSIDNTIDSNNKFFSTSLEHNDITVGKELLTSNPYYNFLMMQKNISQDQNFFNKLSIHNLNMEENAASNRTEVLHDPFQLAKGGPTFEAFCSYLRKCLQQQQEDQSSNAESHQINRISETKSDSSGSERNSSCLPLSNLEMSPCKSDPGVRSNADAIENTPVNTATRFKTTEDINTERMTFKDINVDNFTFEEKNGDNFSVRNNSTEQQETLHVDNTLKRRHDSSTFFDNQTSVSNNEVNTSTSIHGGLYTYDAFFLSDGRSKKNKTNTSNSFSIEHILQQSPSNPSFQPNPFSHNSYQFSLKPVLSQGCDKKFYSIFDTTHHHHQSSLHHFSKNSPFSFSTNNSPPRHICTKCGKSYATSSNLSRHKQTHRSLDSGQAKKCPHCDKVYVSMPALSMHVLTHDLRHKCQVCGKAFSRPWLLQGHMRSHTGERPYGCAHCGKAFADRSNLRAHMQTHSGMKSYSCRRCHKTFALKSYLTKHLETVCNFERCY